MEAILIRNGFHLLWIPKQILFYTSTRLKTIIVRVLKEQWIVKIGNIIIYRSWYILASLHLGPVVLNSWASVRTIFITLSMFRSNCSSFSSSSLSINLNMKRMVNHSFGPSSLSRFSKRSITFPMRTFLCSISISEIAFVFKKLQIWNRLIIKVMKIHFKTRFTSTESLLVDRRTLWLPRKQLATFPSLCWGISDGTLPIRKQKWFNL